jgi:predicted glycoside hydrolase/deacetylase ChbG (UPF0249 family)
MSSDAFSDRTYCIFNADDLGASRGINRGILRAHHEGVLTSASLVVNAARTEDAVHLAREAPDLSLGLHVNFTNETGPPLVDLDDTDACRTEALRQLDRFQDLVGCEPTHLDSHHNVHRRPHLASCFSVIAEDAGIPLRGSSPARYFPDFYGQWDGQTHPEQISTDHLIEMVREELGPGITEISCHPGYVDPEYDTPYHAERELELQTLCDPRLAADLERLEIRLMGFREVRALLWTGAD